MTHWLVRQLCHLEGGKPWQTVHLWSENMDLFLQMTTQAVRMRQKQAMCQETVKDQETYSTSAELLQGVAFAIKGETNLSSSIIFFHIQF